MPVDHQRQWIINASGTSTPVEHQRQWYIGHRRLFSIFSSVLCCRLHFLQPSRCILLSTSSPDLFSRCSLVVLFLCGHVTSTGVLAWQYCHRTFLESVRPSQVHSFFVVSGSELLPVQFFSATPCWCLASDIRNSLQTFVNERLQSVCGSQDANRTIFHQVPRSRFYFVARALFAIT